MQIFIVLLYCVLMTTQTLAAPTLRANGKIAFTSNRDGNSEIYLMNVDGTQQTRLTDSAAFEDYPSWSPDGQRTAFLKQSGGVYSVNLMNADGSNQTQVTTLNPIGRAFSIGWSPDGARLVFQDAGSIFTVNLDGSNRVNLTNSQFASYAPTWSPDGSRIAFVRSLSSHGYYPEIFTMDASTGGSFVQITNSLPYTESISPDWSPDGGQIIFSDAADSLSNTDSISLINPDGRNYRQILTGGDTVNHAPKWSPDGTKTVFHRSGFSNPSYQIWAINRDGTGLTQLTTSSQNNFHPDWQPLAPVVDVANIEDLYSAVNNQQNAGSQIVIAPGVYTLSANAPGGAARPNGGRLELQENMSLKGVQGNREAVVIDAINLPASSYSAPIANTGAIRTGRGTNSVEWLTIRNAVNGGAGVIAHLSAPGTAFVRIAHIVSTGNSRGIDVRNIGGGASSTATYAIEAEIVDNDIYNNRLATGQGIRIINSQGGRGNIVSATLSGNRSYSNGFGFLIENTGSTSLGNISVSSSGDRFYENGAGGLIGGGLGIVNGNTVNFTAIGSVFENNNGTNSFNDLGGLIVIGGENTAIPNGVTNNTVNVVLRNCRFANNQRYDLGAFGARSLPAAVGTPGTNNRAIIRLYGTQIPNLVTTDSSPDYPAGMNSVTVIRNSVVPAFDYDGDGRADLSVFRPFDRFWYLNRNQGGFDSVQFGLSTDKLVPADYDGDGKTDIAVFRAGIWYLRRSQLGLYGIAFGVAEDIPQPADFDGDGRAEIAVWRPSTGTWYIYNLATSQFSFFQLGTTGDKPIVGDYDGDGRADYAVFRPSEGTWYLQRSQLGLTAIPFGISTDKLVPADYDGDGKTDIAVFRPQDRKWYLRQSSAGLTIVEFGLGTDKPTPADYDGDGKADIAVFRDGIWYLLGSRNGFAAAFFGLNSDQPVPNSFVP